MEDCEIETGLQMFSRIKELTTHNLKFSMFPSGPYPNQIIEIIGSSSTGKTLMLMDFVVKCILPKQYKGIDLPGNSKCAVLINTDHQINLFNVIDLIEFTLKTYVKSAISDLIEDCLKNITVLNCYSSEQLKFTILNLEKLLQENSNISVVALDSLSAYYWSDRLDLGVISFNAYCSSVLDDLKTVVKDFGIVTFFTRPEIETTLKSHRVKVDYSIRLKVLPNDNYEALLLDREKNIFCAKYLIKRFIVFVN